MNELGFVPAANKMRLITAVTASQANDAPPKAPGKRTIQRNKIFHFTKAILRTKQRARAAWPSRAPLHRFSDAVNLLSLLKLWKLLHCNPCVGCIRVAPDRGEYQFREPVTFNLPVDSSKGGAFHKAAPPGPHRGAMLAVTSRLCKWQQARHVRRRRKRQAPRPPRSSRRFRPALARAPAFACFSRHAFARREVLPCRLVAHIIERLGRFGLSGFRQG